MLKRVVLGIVLAGQFIVACSSTYVPAVPLEVLVAPSAETDYASAFEACGDTPEPLKNIMDEIYLYKIKGLWVGLSGRSNNWTCYYYALEQHRSYVYQSRGLSLTQIIEIPPAPLNRAKILDSDEVLRRLWSQSSLAFPLYALSLTSKAWTAASAGNEVTLDAVQGIFINE